MKRFHVGFTVVELVVVAPIVVLTIGIFITLIVNMVGDVLATRAATKLTYDIQDALNIIEGDIKLSTTFLSANNITLEPGSKQGYDNSIAGFENVGPNGDMLILNMFATTGNPISTTSAIVYKKDAPDNCISSNIANNTPLTYNIVYFVKDSTLWRRTIMPVGYTTAGCNIPWQQPSCSPNITDSFCAVKDMRLVDGVEPADFTVGYFNSPSSEINDPISENTTNSNAIRQDSLNGLLTAEISINSNQTISGRSISQSGTIRATRLDTNASLLAKVVPDIVPAMPVIRASINPATPTTVDFSWDPVPGAVNYTVDYSLDGGGGGAWYRWSNDTTNTSYSVPTEHGKNACISVNAHGTTGSSGGTARCLTIPIWTAPLLAANWANFAGSYKGAVFTKTSAGVVVLEGLVKRTSGSVVPYETLFVLPPGYRPADRQMYVTQTNPNTYSRIDIDADGSVQCGVCSGNWVSLNGITFVPSSTNMTWSSPTFINSWVNFGGNWAGAAYAKDSVGRAHIRGLVASGVVTNDTGIITANASYGTTKYHHVTVANNDRAGHLGINATGTILSKTNNTNGYLSLNTMYYPGTTGSWNPLTLQNGWLIYNTTNFTSPEYTKAADGIVTLRGLIKDGTLPGIAATLPVGARPKERIILTSIGSAAIARIDIDASGNIIIQNATSSAWVSLDGLSFVAEQ